MPIEMQYMNHKWLANWYLTDHVCLLFSTSTLVLWVVTGNQPSWTVPENSLLYLDVKLSGWFWLNGIIIFCFLCALLSFIACCPCRAKNAHSGKNASVGGEMRAIVTTYKSLQIRPKHGHLSVFAKPFFSDKKCQHGYRLRAFEVTLRILLRGPKG